MGDTDLLLARLAELQAGHVATRQLRALELTDAAIRRRVVNGRLVRVDKAVYRVAGVPSSWEGQLLTAVLRFGSAAAVSHRCAAVLLGLDAAVHEPPIEVVVRRARRERVSRGVVVHSSSSFDRLDLAWVARHLDARMATAPALARARPITRFRVTSAARTIIDLAPQCSAHELGNLIDSAAAKRLLTDAYLRQRMAVHRARRQPGMRLLDEVLLDAGGHTWLERRFLRLVRTAGLHRPQCQVVHRAGGRFVARVDFEFAPASVIVEVSGRRGHVSESDRRRDARRRNTLQQTGYLVLEFVTADIIDEPRFVISTLQEALGRFPAVFPMASDRKH